MLIALPAGRRAACRGGRAARTRDGSSGCERRRATRRAAGCSSAARSERVDSILDDPEVDQERRRAARATTGLYVPLRRRATRRSASIVVHDKLGPRPALHRRRSAARGEFATRAAVAVDLSERVARDAVRRVVDGQELERERLARELHDETGQALTSILLGLKTLEEPDVEESAPAVAELRELVVATLQDVRRLAVELRPTALDDFGLGAALDGSTRRSRSRRGIDVAPRGSAARRRAAAGEVETALYRIVQEALTNVVKHAARSG